MPTTSYAIAHGSKDVLLPGVFTDAALTIKLIAGTATSDWYRAGYMRILLPLGGAWIPVRSVPITWNQILEIPYASYRLSFTPQGYLPDCQIFITPYPISYHPMGIYNPATLPPTTGADSSTPITASATNVVLAAANAARAPGGLIVNNATKVMYATFTGAAATAAAPSIPIPANGGALDIPGGYTGAINGIWASGATGTAIIHEFTYQ